MLLYAEGANDRFGFARDLKGIVTRAKWIGEIQFTFGCRLDRPEVEERIQNFVSELLHGHRQASRRLAD